MAMARAGDNLDEPRTQASTAVRELTGMQFTIWVLLHTLPASKLKSTSANELAQSWGVAPLTMRRSLAALDRMRYITKRELTHNAFAPKCAIKLERRLDASSGSFMRFSP